MEGVGEAVCLTLQHEVNTQALIVAVETAAYMLTALLELFKGSASLRAACR